MSIYLQKFLKKIGVKKYEDLNAEEKETYRAWEEALSGKAITNEDYRKFLEVELGDAIVRLTDENIKLNTEADIFRRVEVRFIKKVLGFLDSPLVEKKVLEEQIKSQL